jgi:omega-6 fatty acid desaturase (delta-12 desaturase)
MQAIQNSQAMLEPQGWRQILARYQVPDTRRSIWQLVNTLVPYAVLWYLMFLSLKISYLLTLALAVLAAGFMVRIFIIFHDCGHGSFFKSKKANEIVGAITGILTFTPWYRWWHDHAVHHATAGDLDRRGVGDVYTMTVEEYLAAPWWKKLSYRLMREPIFLFTIGPTLVFALAQRFYPRGTGRRERLSVHLTNLALAIIIAAFCLTVGWKAYLMVQLPVLVIGTSVGVWLFYVQHQFEGVYWARHKDWNFYKAAVYGASYYQLPRVLQWFTGNIGFHHIHHLGPRIPNYNLPRAYAENPIFHVEPLTLRSSLKCLKWRLYDEVHHKLVGWDALKKYRPAQA